MSAPLSVFEELRREQLLCDAVLNVAGTQFPVHKLILCGCSTYFKDMFTQRCSPDSRDFDIPHVSADIMKIILDYAYTGVIHIPQENLHKLFMAADYFKISGISQACCQVMIEQLSPSNCIDTWQFTNYPQLTKQSFLYILTHFEEGVASSEAFLQLSMEDLCSIIVEDQLNVREENTVLEAVLRWVGHAPQERNMHLASLLSKIRLALVYPQSNSLRNACLAVVMETMLNAQIRGSNASLSRPRLPREVLIVIGGLSGGNPTNSIEAYDNRANRWVDVANYDETLGDCHATVYLNRALYLIGEYNRLFQFNTMHKYDLANRTWQEVAPMHSPRGYVSVALLDGFIYAMGGFSGNERLDTAERYSPETNQWTMIASMNEQRSSASSTAYNRKIYICGGFTGAQDLSTAECYNPLTNQWTMIAEMSCRRRGLGVIAYANEIYAVGGVNGLFRLNSVEAYNPNTNTWRPLPSMQVKRSHFGIAVVEDRLYVVGGYEDISIIRSVESFDTRTGVWSEVDDMKVSRNALSCSVVFDLPNMADYAAPRSGPPGDDSTEV